MSRPPRNRELERLVVDALRSTTVDALARRQAWEVYADWLLSLGEPVGEWLAASLRADDDGEAAAPLRARLADIEVASRYRLVDLDLADLVEVPELSRIADLTWERGFVTRASIHGKEFRGWDSELLEHTPDRLVEVILRSPSACMLHHLELDGGVFEARGARFDDLGALLRSLDEPLSLRALAFDSRARGVFGFGERVQAQLLELRTLKLRAGTLDLHASLELPELRELELEVEHLSPGSVEALLATPLDRLRRLSLRVEGESVGQGGRASRLPLGFDVTALLPMLDDLGGVRSLELAWQDAGDRIVDALLGSPVLDRLERLVIGHVSDAGAAAICRAPERFARLADFEVHASKLERALAARLRAIGCTLR